jgi:Tfp pilus assembly protein PilF
VPQQQQMQPPQLAAPQPTRQQPVSSALPPAAVKSFRSGGFFSSSKGNKNDGIDISLPKSLEAQGQEVGRLGQLVRQLAGEGKYKEALESAKQRHVLCEGTYGAEHVLTATCLNDVATFVQAFGNFDEAEKLFEKASRIQRKVLGDCHPHSIATLQNLVSLYASKGDMKKKEGMELLVQAMKAAAAASSPQ